MEKFIADYLRLLDMDPAGNFIRLINRSHQQTLDLSNVCLQQVNKDAHVCNSYTFDKQSPSLLPHDEVLTIYSRDYRRLKFDIRPYMIIAKDISRWSTDDRLRTELSLNHLLIDSQTRHTLAIDDVPCLFIQHSIDHKQRKQKTKSHSARPGEFHYPYCFSTDNIVNPHTRGHERRPQRYSCSEPKQNVKHFDEYPRRLTTASSKEFSNDIYHDAIGLKFNKPASKTRHHCNVS